MSPFSNVNRSAGAYHRCRWCQGNGCLACPGERKKDEQRREAEYAAAFPNGPEPLFTAHFDNPEEMATLKAVFGMDALKQHFDTSDITDEEVYAFIGQGSVSQGQAAIALSAGLVQMAGGDYETAKKAALAQARQQMAGARGVGRIQDALKQAQGEGDASD